MPPAIIIRCHSPDVECTAPTSKENYICCPTTDICALMENTDKEGVFLALCVPDPRACSPGMFSCASMFNSCCPDGYLCDVRTWENLTYPVCLASPSLGKRTPQDIGDQTTFPTRRKFGTKTPTTTPTTTDSTTSSPTTPTTTDSTTSSPTTPTTTSSTTSSPTTPTATSSPHQTSQPTDTVSGGNGTSLHRTASVGLVVGSICGSLVVILAVVFAIRRYRRRRIKGEETLNDMEDPRRHEFGGAEIPVAQESELAERPNQGAPLHLYGPRKDGDSSRIRDEKSQQPAAEKPQ